MITRRVVVASASGLHARPAALFTQAAGQADVPVQICKPGGVAVDASSILMVMQLSVQQGDEVELSAEGPTAEAALDTLVELLQKNLDEE